ncbi:hypothetical protein X943_000959 [Babesia divergens]|uniref:Uncharacterized protein n=1 Tax=Babesia divergens TaxID=32595 RepID=A0AAD9GJC1_BABDI|nr:hypothetical protein X943_000959 [Babesia divergens]
MSMCSQANPYATCYLALCQVCTLRRYYEGDYYVMTNGSLTMRLLALVTTLAMNILPLFLPFLVGSLLNRINTQQNGYQTME